MEYHKPVMLQECLEALNIKPNGVYVDLTFGGGGHSLPILNQLSSEGRLIGFDQDPDAKANAPQDKRFTLFASNFRFFPKYLKLQGFKQVDGILADLGVSSHQIDEASRGFSTRFDAVLDMRMDQKGDKTAASVVNEYAEADLVHIFSAYGEIKNSRTLARAIVDNRGTTAIETTAQLNDIIRPLGRRGKENKYLAQVYQALRIEVNEELKSLQEMLTSSAPALKEGGRLVIMSYHSLEDRLVKYYMATGDLKGRQEKDFYGNLIRPLEPINRKPILASDDEISQNNRARSAKLRIGEKRK